jgi:hypothetical protein
MNLGQRTLSHHRQLSLREVVAGTIELIEAMSLQFDCKFGKGNGQEGGMGQLAVADFYVW